MKFARPILRSALMTGVMFTVSTPLYASAQSQDTSELPKACMFSLDNGALSEDCTQEDSLYILIENIENANRSDNPIQAGAEGNKAALRKLPDVSYETSLQRNKRVEAWVRRHKAMEDKIETENRLNYDLLGFVLSQQALLNPFDHDRIPFTNDSGFHNLLTIIARQTRFNNIGDYENYAARLSDLPRFFEQNITNMRRGIRTDYTASSEILPGIINVVETLAATPLEDHPFFAAFMNIPQGYGLTEISRLKTLGEQSMQQAVYPAYKDLLKFLKTEYAPQARDELGVSTTAQGREHYRALVKYFTTLDLTPDEVHDIGLSEVARIRGEMDDIIKELEFEGSFSDFLDFLRTDPQFYATSKEELLKQAAWLAKQVDGRMPEFFGKLPRLPYGVIPVPDEIAPNYTTGRYWNGNPAQGRAGNYVVNTYDLKQRPLYNLPALTLHEGVPGHHHQISLSQELKDVPNFRKSLYPNAFGEGWGLYSEKLGVEMGLYKTPYENFGRLTYEMWRACRLVVDTGIHWKGWTREQAENCFYENSALAAHNIRTEVERYISWPGQALAYKIGELKIIELRKRAEDALGQNFSIRRFHDAILEEGGMPLNLLEAKIDRWIAAQKQ